jgi:competence ComEA-like helix-hairpin-helix protein
VPAIAPANAAELERRETQTPAVVIQVMPVLRAAGIGLGPPVPIDEPLLQPSQSESAREATPNTTKPAAATPPAAKPTQAAPTPPQATRPQATPPTANTSTLIDLNAATKSQLELLPGIGPALAQRVLDHRAKLGGFTKVEDLDGVRGIGPKVLAKLRPLVRVGPKPVLQSEGARDASQPTTQPSGPPR